VPETRKIIDHTGYENTSMFNCVQKKEKKKNKKKKEKKKRKLMKNDNKN